MRSTFCRLCCSSSFKAFVVLLGSAACGCPSAFLPGDQLSKPVVCSWGSDSVKLSSLVSLGVHAWLCLLSESISFLKSSQITGGSYPYVPATKPGCELPPLCVYMEDWLSRGTEKEIRVMQTGLLVLGPQLFGSVRWFVSGRCVSLSHQYCSDVIISCGLLWGWAGRKGKKKREKTQGFSYFLWPFIVPFPTYWTRKRGCPWSSVWLYAGHASGLHAAFQLRTGGTGERCSSLPVQNNFSFWLLLWSTF